MNLQVFDSKPGVAKQMSQYVGLLHQRMTEQLKEISFPFGAVGDRTQFCSQEQANLEKAISRRFP
ncbi:hypothetical protein SD81_039250 [Tolypothrix campylonemoides VB511288]|nr:hypothetical protein SD81_039250 [Tolypothrix campylonemoides VB511288]